VISMLSFLDTDGARAGADRSVLGVFARQRLGRLLASRGRGVGQRTATTHVSGPGNAKSPPALTGAALVSADEEDIAALLYELLDAHADTAELAAAYASEEQWQAHLDYLRALQRKGRETLARLGAP
jgi:hypothetical protein